MAKAEDDKRAEAKDNPRTRTRAVARSKTSEAMAKPNEGEVTEAAIDDWAEKETVAKTNETEAADVREYAGTEIEQDVRQDAITESNVDDVAVQEIGTEQIKSNTSAPPLFSMRSKRSPPKRAIIRDGCWRTALLSLQNCWVRRLSKAPFRFSRNMPRRLHAGYVAYVMRMAELRANLTKEFFQPIEAAITKIQTFNP